jgi:uncharacterized repeat protein (TIGR04076 family)
MTSKNSSLTRRKFMFLSSSAIASPFIMNSACLASAQAGMEPSKSRTEFRVPNVIKITIVGTIMNSSCPRGYKVGSSWIIDGFNTPSPPMCAIAYAVIHECIAVMQYGGEFPWGEKDSVRVPCTDLHVGNIYEITRLPEKVKMTPP